MKSFTFYDIYYTPLQALSDEQAGKFFRKICNWLEGKQTETDGLRWPRDVLPQRDLPAPCG